VWPAPRRHGRGNNGVVSVPVSPLLCVAVPRNAAMTIKTEKTVTIFLTETDITIEFGDLTKEEHGQLMSLWPTRSK